MDNATSSTPTGFGSVGLKPSDEARKMKRNQQAAFEENVIALLNRRNNLQSDLRQVAADLKYVGYQPPEEAPQPLKLTSEEWAKRIAETSVVMSRADRKREVEEDTRTRTLLAEARVRNLQYKNKIDRLELQAKAKPAKNKVAKKK